MENESSLLNLQSERWMCCLCSPDFLPRSSGQPRHSQPGSLTTDCHPSVLHQHQHQHVDQTMPTATFLNISTAGALPDRNSLRTGHVAQQPQLLLRHAAESARMARLSSRRALQDCLWLRSTQVVSMRPLEIILTCWLRHVLTIDL